MSISEKNLKKLRQIVGDSNIITSSESLYNYSVNITSKEEIIPAAVLIPKNTEEISKILKICNDSKVSVVVRGGGTGVSKGALSYKSGIILSLEKLNKVLAINTIDRTVVVESGVVTQTLRDEVEKKGLVFPQNISSSNSCFIGGNVAVSSGSPKSLKYGTTKNYVLNMEVVLPNGQIIWTGKNVKKNAVGYNLTQLFVGSEGTLGVITKVVLQLTLPMKETLLMVPFSKIGNLFDCVHHFFSEGFSASSLEFIDKKGYDITSKFLNKKIQTKSEIEGVLWLEFEGSNEEILFDTVTKISKFIPQYTAEEIFIAQSHSEIANLCSLRSKLGYAVINHTSFRDVDIVVPLSKIHEIYTFISQVLEKYNLEYTAFGHIGDGNFHLNIFQNEGFSNEEWINHSNKGVSEIFSKTVELGGTISGEHGLGNLHKPFLNIAMSKYQRDIMGEIKSIFDKNNILG